MKSELNEMLVVDRHAKISRRNAAGKTPFHPEQA